jgi:MraZ protein
MIPVRFRRHFSMETGGAFVLAMGKEKCLNLFPFDEWNENILEKLHKMPAGPQKRKVVRFYSTNSRTLNVDKAGRIAIPPNFLESIGNVKRVIVIGTLNYMEIWAPEDFEEAMHDVQESFLGGDWEY